jgi:hypothetical protein
MDKVESLYTLAEKVRLHRDKKEIDEQKAYTLKFIDHLLARTTKKVSTINGTIPIVFKGLRYLHASASCADCNKRLEAWLKEIRPMYETVSPPETNQAAQPPQVLIPELWGYKAGETILNPENEQSTIVGFTSDKQQAVLESNGTRLTVTKDILLTYIRP